jgi:hypothetical protein
MQILLSQVIVPTVSEVTNNKRLALNKFFLYLLAKINYQLLIHAGHLKNPNLIVVSFFTFQDEDGLAIFSFDFMYLLRKTCLFVYGANT